MAKINNHCYEDITLTYDDISKLLSLHGNDLLVDVNTHLPKLGIMGEQDEMILEGFIWFRVRREDNNGLR